jgi:hypothetical protein
MDPQEKEPRERKRVSTGPLKIHQEGAKLYVTGFGLWIPVETEKEGRELIAELEDQGFRICY